MKKTPSYDEDEIEMPTFEIKLPLVPIAPIEKGCNLMLKDIYKCAQSVVYNYKVNRNCQFTCSQLFKLLKRLNAQPDDSYYDSYLADPQSRNFPSYYKHIVIRKKDVFNYIIDNLPDLYKQAYKKGYLLRYIDDVEGLTNRLMWDDDDISYD